MGLAVDKSPIGCCPLQGIANLVGVTWLSSLLRDASIKYALANSSLGFVAAGMPFLQVWYHLLP